MLLQLREGPLPADLKAGVSVVPTGAGWEWVASVAH